MQIILHSIKFQVPLKVATKTTTKCYIFWTVTEAINQSKMLSLLGYFSMGRASFIHVFEHSFIAGWSPIGGFVVLLLWWWWWPSLTRRTVVFLERFLFFCGKLVSQQVCQLFQKKNYFDLRQSLWRECCVTFGFRFDSFGLERLWEKGVKRE